MNRRIQAQQIIEGVARRLSVNDDTAVKQQILDAYCDERISQETAMRMIRELGVVHA